MWLNILVGLFILGSLPVAKVFAKINFLISYNTALCTKVTDYNIWLFTYLDLLTMCEFSIYVNNMGRKIEII